MFYAIAGVLAVIGVILVVVGRKKSGLKSKMEATPTTPIGSIEGGRQVELKGIAHCDQPLETPETGAPCVYYAYELKRRERRHSSSGSTQYHWRTIDSGSSRVPFTLQDTSGTVAIDPEGAKIDAPKVIDRDVKPGENLEDGLLKGLISAASVLGGSRQKILVHAVACERELYVLGYADRDPQGALKVSAGEEQFFISTKSEEQLAKSLGLQSMLFYVGGAVLMAGAITALVMALVMALR